MKILSPAEWPSESDLLRGVEKYGPVTICQYWDKAAKDYRRIYCADHARFIAWIGGVFGLNSPARICYCLSADPMLFVYFVWSEGKLKCASSPQAFAPADFSDLACQALHLAKKGHTGSVLARQAWSRSREKGEFIDYDEEHFKYMFGGALKSFRNERCPQRPHFLDWKLVERGPPGEKVEAIEYTLPKCMTLKEYDLFLKGKSSE